MFRGAAMQLAIRKTAVAAVECRIQMTRMTCQFQKLPAGLRQPAFKESRIVDECRIGNAKQGIIAWQTATHPATKPRQDETLEPCAPDIHQRVARFDDAPQMRRRRLMLQYL